MDGHNRGYGHPEHWGHGGYGGYGIGHHGWGYPYYPATDYYLPPYDWGYYHGYHHGYHDHGYHHR